MCSIARNTWVWGRRGYFPSINGQLAHTELTKNFWTKHFCVDINLWKRGERYSLPIISICQFRFEVLKLFKILNFLEQKPKSILLQVHGKKYVKIAYFLQKKIANLQVLGASSQTPAVFGYKWNEESFNAEQGATDVNILVTRGVTSLERLRTTGRGIAFVTAANCLCLA